VSIVASQVRDAAGYFKIDRSEKTVPERLIVSTLELDMVNPKRDLSRNRPLAVNLGGKARDKQRLSPQRGGA
jgi:hypothetical protein